VRAVPISQASWAGRAGLPRALSGMSMEVDQSYTAVDGMTMPAPLQSPRQRHPHLPRFDRVEVHIVDAFCRLAWQAGGIVVISPHAADPVVRLRLLAPAPGGLVADSQKCR
jgi:hypothetical protein